MTKESAGTHIPSFSIFSGFLTQKRSFAVKIRDFQDFFEKMAKNTRKLSILYANFHVVNTPLGLFPYQFLGTSIEQTKSNG